ncbi:hypothetical protein FisN_1Hh457 [Fistulifera solaris]|uniref:Glucose-6-phosphate isomerase n=1 Tax=Fistulifera solaris TaxID=1519565 RepID=A0A1Z5JK84_FISSO|nr:hypothetical protein FisN_1Hh457 [Fistulifera solaris]|eukprot:GAX14262.1 hypothetical protein FisN_1Hh457 [Fistulifera solaris]
MSMRHNAGNGSAPSTSWVLKCTDLPQFDALLAHAERFYTDDKLHLRNLCKNSARCTGLVTIHRTAPALSSYAGIKPRTVILDYSRQRVTGETMELLFDLADAVKMTERREAMKTGVKINTTEDSPVLHHVLRLPENYPIGLQGPYNEDLPRPERSTHRSRSRTPPTETHATAEAVSPTSLKQHLKDGPSLLKFIHTVRKIIQQVTDDIRSGTKRSVSGKPFDSVLCIGVSGGTYFGTNCVASALQMDPAAFEASKGRKLRFVATMDPVDFHQATSDLNPSTTIVVVISKTFTDAETILNARTARSWLVESLKKEEGTKGATETNASATQMFAVTDNPIRSRQFGISKENTFPYLAICGRFSLCSPVGLLPLSLHFSYPVMCDFLKGAHDMDEHFFNAPLYDNIPVLLGLLGVWNSTFLGYSCRAVVPYTRALRDFPAYVQKLDMESNGKRVALDGTLLLHPTGEINLGEVGPTIQHSWIQLLHQGREMPVDFIGFMEPQQHIDVPGEALSHHDELMSHFFAQPDALATGKTVVEIIQEGVSEKLREHQACPGNRPSSSLLMTRLDAYATGQLIAMYEHRTVIQGFIWGINSFDRYGADLGIAFSKKVRSQISNSRKTGASVQGFDASTGRLLEHYLAHRKEADKKKVDLL